MSLDLSLNFPDFNIGMESGSKNHIYEFDGFRLDADRLMLYRDEVEVSMPPKMVKTRVVLVEERGSIIRKDDLIERVWEDSIVDESNLSQHLYHLRKTLGNLPDGRPYIETFRRRGYRFNGDASVVPPVSTVQPTPVVGSSVVERQGNVLRFVDWSPTPQTES